MNRCTNCGRALKVPSASGYGPVCAKRVPAMPSGERDLLGFDLGAAEIAAVHRVGLFTAALAADAHAGFRAMCGAARVRILGETKL